MRGRKPRCNLSREAVRVIVKKLMRLEVLEKMGRVEKRETEKRVFGVEVKVRGRKEVAEMILEGHECCNAGVACNDVIAIKDIMTSFSFRQERQASDGQISILYCVLLKVSGKWKNGLGAIPWRYVYGVILEEFPLAINNKKTTAALFVYDARESVGSESVGLLDDSLLIVLSVYYW